MAAGTPLTRLTLGAASVGRSNRCPIYPNVGADCICPRARPDTTIRSDLIPGPCPRARPCRRRRVSSVGAAA
jgi:hypothetical protein